jgi:GNAT superfamily N-acetyltransferase
MFLALSTSGPTEEIVGEVRGYRYPDSSTLELAIIVRSDMKRLGIGRALMAVMSDYCSANGLDLIAQIKPENRAMIQLARHCGMQVEHVPGSDLAIAYLQHGMQSPRCSYAADHGSYAGHRQPDGRTQGVASSSRPVIPM